jgi:hypothetical protein
MSMFVKPSTINDDRVRDLREDAPSLVVRTQVGRVAVIRLLASGPVIQMRLRPLSPNLPLHSGDAVVMQRNVLDHDGSSTTFHAVVSAHVGYPPERFRL